MLFNNNDNDLFAYFEVINQIEPKTCIDFGPFLKMAGCIARQAKDVSISEEIYVVGVDLEPDIKANIYSTIYNELIAFEQVESVKKSYDLAMALRIGDYCDDFPNTLKWISQNCHYLCTNIEPSLIGISFEKVNYLQVENDRYYVYTFGGK